MTVTSLLLRAMAIAPSPDELALRRRAGRFARAADASEVAGAVRAVVADAGTIA